MCLKWDFSSSISVSSLFSYESTLSALFVFVYIACSQEEYRLFFEATIGVGTHAFE